MPQRPRGYHSFCLFTLQYVAEALVDFASLTAKDVLFDIGCNDGRDLKLLHARVKQKWLSCIAAHVGAGRVVITAARLASTQSIGIEVSETAASKAQQAVVQGTSSMHMCWHGNLA